MMKFELKAISLWPFIKVAVLLNTAFGFLLGILYALFLGFFLSIAGSMSGPFAEELGNADLPIGLLVVILPIFFAVIGGVIYTLIGVVFILMYNLAASLAGGLEFDFVPKAQISPVQQQAAPQAPSYYSSYPGYSPPTSSATAPPPPPPPQQPPNNPPSQGFE